MIKIRYHHLMCIPRYKGEGYSPEFCKNLELVKEKLNDNNYTLVDGCDDICHFCPNNINGKCADEEKVSRYDRLVSEKLKQNESLSPGDICSDCRWFEICKNI